MTENGSLLVHERFETRVRATPDAVAVSGRGAVLSYRELDRRSTQWARGLRRRGADLETLVGVHLRRSPDLIAAMLGVLKAGAAYVPLDPAYPRDRLEFMAEDAAMPIIISESWQATERLTDMPAGPPPALLTPADAMAESRAPLAAPTAKPSNLAYVLYTSGSTGRPKGAALTHGNIANLLQRVECAFENDLDHVLAATSTCFDCHVIEIFGTLAHGGSVVLVDGAMDIGSRGEGQGVTLLHTVPSVVDELLRIDRLPGSARTVILGGERLLPGLVDRIRSAGSIKRIVNIYGPTECTTYATLAEVDHAADGPPSIGRPEHGTRIQLLDEAGAPVSDGEPGELYIGGDPVSRGYVRRPGQTAERYLPDPWAPGERLYRTGDLAHRDHGGDLHFLGRADNQIKIRGVRIEPAEVERTLLEHPSVIEAAVAAASSNGGDRLLTAYLVAAGGKLPEDIRAFCESLLPRQLRPDAYVLMDRLPRTVNGKLDRLRLPGLTLETLECAADGADQPHTSFERLLAELWAKVLRLDRIGRHDNVFDLGGHSLVVLSVRNQVAERLKTAVPLRLLFEHPTIAAAGEELERLCSRTSAQQLTSAERPRTEGPRTEGARAEEPRERAGSRYPLSLNQQAVLARVANDPDDPWLVFPLVVRLQGPVSPYGVAAAIKVLVGRHDGLRSAISEEGDVAVASSTDVEVPVIDLRALPPERVEQIAEDITKRLLSRGLAFTPGQILRVALLRLGEDDYVYAQSLHHFAADAWSVETLSHQLLGLYADCIHGRPGPSALPPQYSDWATEQRVWLDSETGRRRVADCRKRLGELPVLRPPEGRTRHDRPGSALLNAFLIPSATADRLSKVAALEGATKHMVLMAAFAVILGRRSGQTDLAIGCPTSGRALPDAAELIGPCYDALVVRVDLNRLGTFRELLRRVRDSALDAYSDEGVPFAVLAEGNRAAGAHHPLFQASIVYQQPPSLLNPMYSRGEMARQPIGDLAISGFIEFAPPPTALDLDLALFDAADGIEAILTGRPDVTSPAELERLGNDLCALLEGVVSRPEADLASLL
jgi:amino acid adenylation domain-containing protein